MERTYIADIKNNLGKPVLVQGFVENLRDSKYMAFIVLKDISGKIQITVEKEKLPELCPVIASLTQDSVISVVGTAVENDFVKMGGVEITPRVDNGGIDSGRTADSAQGDSRHEEAPRR